MLKCGIQLGRKDWEKDHWANKYRERRRSQSKNGRWTEFLMPENKAVEVRNKYRKIYFICTNIRDNSLKELIQKSKRIAKNTLSYSGYSKIWTPKSNDYLIIEFKI